MLSNVVKVMYFVMFFWNQSNGEIYSAITDMKVLLQTQESIMRKLSAHIQKEELRIKNLTVHINRFKKEMYPSPNYLKNPVNVLRLVKKLIADLLVVEKEIQKEIGFTRNKNNVYPTTVDFVGAAHGIVQLQDTYLINTTTLANGRLLDIYSIPFTQSDCYELAKGMYMAKDFAKGTEWMEVAYKKYDKMEQDTHSFRNADIAEHTCYGYHKIGRYKTAGDWLKLLLNLRPGDPKYSDHVKSLDYFDHLSNLEELKELKRIQANKPPPKPKPEAVAAAKLINEFYKACRMERDIPRLVAYKLQCKYLTETHPFLKIAPVKMEQLFLNPDILLYYDVISNAEIEVLKNLSKSEFKRAQVKSAKTGGQNVTASRISKMSWLADNASNVVSIITRRISTFTGHNLTNAEDLQTANYGLAGFFGPHYDTGVVKTGAENNSVSKFYNDRLATFTLYLSDVRYGGETVFPKLGLTVRPTKGAALYWRNISPLGSIEDGSYHASCPVIHGSKWIATKWIPMAGNEELCAMDAQKLSLEQPRRRRRKPSIYLKYT